LIMIGNIHRLIKEIHALKDRSRPALEALFRQFDSELLG
jgi:hypothetical protein